MEKIKSELKRWKELVVVSIPFIFLQAFTDFSLFADRYHLAQYGIDHLQACIYAGAAASIFDGLMKRSAFMTKTFVGKAWGSGDYKKIGPIIWQMIWYCVFSNFFVLPAGYFMHSWYFEGEAAIVSNYFYGLLAINSLFSLSIVLAAFYTGRGKKGIVSIAMVTMGIFFVILNRSLVLGVPGFIPAMGLKGSFLSIGISYSLLNLTFLTLFLLPKNREKYNTTAWKLDIPQFTQLAKTCIPYGMAMALAGVSYSLNVKTIKLAGEDYFLCLSLLSSFVLIFGAPTLILTQGLLVLFSQQIGARDFSQAKKYLYSSLRICLAIAIAMIFPLWMKSDQVLSWFFKDYQTFKPLSVEYLKLGSLMMVPYIFVLGAERIYTSLFNSFGETKYVFGYLAVYLSIGVPVVYLCTTTFGLPPWTVGGIIGSNIVLFRILPYIYRSNISIWNREDYKKAKA